MDKKDLKEEQTDSGFGSLPIELQELTLEDQTVDSNGEGCVEGQASLRLPSVENSTSALDSESSVESKSFTGLTVENEDRGGKCGIDLEQDEDGDNELHLAICTGNEGLAMKLIECISCMSINAQNRLGQTPLFLAVCTRMTRIIRRLIDVGADVSLVDINGNSIIHAAADLGLYVSMREIFTKPNFRDLEQFSMSLKCLLEAKNYAGLTALHLAARKQNMDMMKLLVDIGCDVDATDLTAGFTSLHHLVSTGDVSLVYDFISICNPNVNAISFSGVTPLHLATSSNLQPIADILLILGADARRETLDGFTWQNLVTNQALMSFG